MSDGRWAGDTIIYMSFWRYEYLIDVRGKSFTMKFSCRTKGVLRGLQPGDSSPPQIAAVGRAKP